MTIKKITSKKQAQCAVDMFLIPKMQGLGVNAIAPINQYEFDTTKKEISDVLNLLNDYLREEEN